MLTNPYRICSLLVITAAILLPAGSAQAQRTSGQRSSVPRYVPASPTTSRYLALLNDTGGLVSNYYGVVRPQQRLTQITDSQKRQITAQEIQLEDFQQQAAEEQVRPTGQSAWFRQGAPMGGYRDRSHYYFRWDDQRLRTPARR